MSTIGKYEVREKIGSGGFGVVYRGFDPFIHREVAIKTCSSDEDEVRRRFDNEARIAGNLQHRNITTVYDFGHHGDTPYLVQEYLTGEDLDRKIKRKENLSFSEKLLYLIQIGRGLAFAHDNGVIHRDVKPANIRILEDGTTKIMDFGIAKLAQQETSLTKTGLTVGTAAYLAPEQVTGNDIDCRTDIFSYGVLAYELLTYERPFPGPRISNVLYQIAQQPHTPLRKFWPECPEMALAVVERCLQKRPQDRYDDCHALLADLDRILNASRQDREDRLSNRTQAVEVAAETTRLEVSREQLRPRPADEWQPPDPVSGTALSTQPQDPLSAVPRSAPVQSSPSGPIGESVRRTQPVMAQPTQPVMPLAEMDLGLGNRSTPEPRPSRHPNRHRAEKASPLPWILLGMVVVILALGIGWQIGNQGNGAPPSSPEEPSSAVAVQDAATTSETVAPTSEPPAETPAQNDLNTPAIPAATAEPRDEAPQPAQEAIAPGVLVIAAGWDPRMTFEVDGQSQAMDRDRRVSLPAGRHEVVFRYSESDYQVRRTVAVELAAGEQRSLRSPIGRPGSIRVQAKLGSPQGRVLVDGSEVGSSPIEKRLTPGQHTIEIVGNSGSSTRVEVEVPAARKVMITFDLRGSSPPRVITSES